MPSPRKDQTHFVADLAETPLTPLDTLEDSTGTPSSPWGEVWKNLRRNPAFMISTFLILCISFLVAFPSALTDAPPDAECFLENSLGGPTPGHLFGFDKQGCDVFARTVYGARASVTIGLLTTVSVVIIGGLLGALAGFFGGIVDSILSRLTDVFFAIPFILAAVLLLQLFKGSTTVLSVVLVLALFSWPQIARITRGAVIAARNSEFVLASTAIGNTRIQNLTRHVLPNAIAPVIVTATLSVGIFIAAEATLSFLGLGLPPSVISWGGDISSAQTSLRQQPMVMFYPAAALALTVLSFILLGDAVSDAVDPKARKR